MDMRFASLGRYNTRCEVSALHAWCYIYPQLNSSLQTCSIPAQQRNLNSSFQRTPCIGYGALQYKEQSLHHWAGNEQDQYVLLDCREIFQLTCKHSLPSLFHTGPMMQSHVFILKSSLSRSNCISSHTNQGIKALTSLMSVACIFTNTQYCNICKCK